MIQKQFLLNYCQNFLKIISYIGPFLNKKCQAERLGTRIVVVYLTQATENAEAVHFALLPSVWKVK